MGPLVGARRTRVNPQLILAQGGSSNVYSLLDGLQGVAPARGTGRSVVVRYVVDIVRADGLPNESVGPFEVRLDRPAAPSRRHR